MSADAPVPLLRRLRPGHWAALDVLGALLVAVAWVPPLVGGTSDAEAWFGAFAGLLGAALLAVPLALRRRWPRTAFGMALVAFGLSLATTVVPVVPLGSVPMALVTYTAVSRSSRRASLVLLASIVLVVSAATTVWTGRVAWPRLTVLLPGAVVVIGWVAGMLAAQYRAYAESLRAQRDAEVRRTVADERLRIARELHDVVAHSMSVITIQADMGRLVLDRKPAVAGAALGVIETTGREAVVELRRMLGVLREESAVPLHPLPGLAGLDGLTERTAAAGVRVDVIVRGTPRPLPAGVDLSAYRIVQEALTNVVKHAGTGSCRVTIEYGNDSVTVEVIDRGRGGPVMPGGHGLVGMRERALLCGGELSADPLPGGGFRVAARLPDGTR
jgi:signal transduction histidine kinase